MWRLLLLQPRKGSIEVGGSLWYNGLVFALCEAILARTRNEAMADTRFPKRPFPSSGLQLSIEMVWRLLTKLNAKLFQKLRILYAWQQLSLWIEVYRVTLRKSWYEMNQNFDMCVLILVSSTLLYARIYNTTRFNSKPRSSSSSSKQRASQKRGCQA